MPAWAARHARRDRRQQPPATAAPAARPRRHFNFGYANATAHPLGGYSARVFEPGSLYGCRPGPGPPLGRPRRRRLRGPQPHTAGADKNVSRGRSRQFGGLKAPRPPSPPTAACRP